MSDNDLVPCTLGQICKKEVLNEPGYKLIWVTAKFDEKFLSIQDCRPGLGANYYFLQKTKFKDGHFILMDEVTYKSIMQVDFYKFMFGDCKLYLQNFQPNDYKYVPIEVTYYLGAYSWTYRQEPIKKEKPKLEEKPKKGKKDGSK